MVNSFRYGLDTDRQADSFDQAELGGGLGYLDVSVAGVQLGPATYLPRVEPLEVRNEFADDVSWVEGQAHDQVRVHLRACQRRRQLPQQPVWILHLSDRDLFRAGLHAATPPAPRTSRRSARRSAIRWCDYAIKDIGFYLQDQWKVTDRLTVTLGARYEHTFAPPPPAANPLFPLTGATLHTGTMDLMPRIGLAYRINDKTVIRAGAGTFFARLVGGTAGRRLHRQRHLSDLGQL